LSDTNPKDLSNTNPKDLSNTNPKDLSNTNPKDLSNTNPKDLSILIAIYIQMWFDEYHRMMQIEFYLLKTVCG
jgi:hypothetical protein